MGGNVLGIVSNSLNRVIYGKNKLFGSQSRVSHSPQADLPKQNQSAWGAWAGWEAWEKYVGGGMYSLKYKGRCTKKRIGKCKDVVRCYDDIMLAYLDVLEKDDSVAEVLCNVPLDDFVLGQYSTDFVCTMQNGELRVRECVFRSKIANPTVVKWLDASRNYWVKRGVTDWGIVIDEEK